MGVLENCVARDAEAQSEELAERINDRGCGGLLDANRIARSEAEIF